ncbi:MAG: ABC transporter permease [Myxococcales bacterium]|nr:ABC transporter permease [Myxococcales bacterium]
MAAPAFESFVGWRYLLCASPRPRILLVGLAVVAFGLCVTHFGTQVLGEGNLAGVLFSRGPETPKVVVGVGMALCGLGCCVALYGALYTFLTAFSAFSAFMVAVSVVVVVLVLGVMNGFQSDLRTKITETQAHIVIESADPAADLSDYRALAATAREVEGVVGATPYLQAETMLTAPKNLQPALLKGIDIETIGEASTLPSRLQEGKLEALADPSLVAPFSLNKFPSLSDDPEAAIRVLDAQIDALKTELEEKAVSPVPVDAELAASGMEIPLPANLTAGPPPSIFLGIELRRNLNLWSGESVNVVSPFGELGPNGPVPKSRPFRLAGWFESGLLEFDTRLAYAHLPVVQRYLGKGDVAGAIQVRVADLEHAREVRDDLQQALGPSVIVRDWQELNSNLFVALRLEKIAMFLVLSIGVLLAAFAIVCTLWMTIIDRRRQIAIQCAMGAHPRAILRIFMFQGAFNGALGAGVGAFLGLSLGFLLSRLELPMDNSVYYLPNIPIDVRAVDVLSIVGVALLISLLSTIYPALHAARLRPVEGLTGA